MNFVIRSAMDCMDLVGFVDLHVPDVIHQISIDQLAIWQYPLSKQDGRYLTATRPKLELTTNRILKNVAFGIVSSV